MAEQMKDSNIEWIGKIPIDWQVTKVKYETDIIGSGTTPDSGNPSYYDDGTLPWIQSGDLYNINYIRQTEKKITNLAVEDFKALSWYEKNFVVVAMYGASVGNVAISKISAFTNQACCAIKLKNKNDLRYLFYFLCAGKEHMLQLAFGGTQPNISQAIIKNLVYLRLPLYEQKAIADFLDGKCAQIDSIAADLEKQTELLQQYKKALITETVSRGLSEKIQLRTSKVKYVDLIPAHWDEKRLSAVAYVRARLGWKGLTADEYVEQGYAFLSAFNVVDNKLDLTDERLNYITKFRYDESPEIQLCNGDVLLVKDGAGLGKCARIDRLPFEATPNGSLAVITPGQRLHYRYLYYFLIGDIFQQRINQIKNGMGVPHLPQGDLRKIIIPIPPMSEQHAISNYLDKRCEILDALLYEKKTQLDKIMQYKQSLIYEYVTGKKRVKEVQ